MIVFDPFCPKLREVKNRAFLDLLKGVFLIEMVPGEGVEPSLPCGNRILNPARLPIPPSGQSYCLNLA